MSEAVNLFGDDIATNTKTQEIVDRVTGMVVDTQKRIEGVPDLTDPVALYVGTAPQGADETDPVWTIQYVSFTATSVSIKADKDIAWSARTSGVYT